MIELIFGLVFTVFPLIIGLAMYNGSGEIYVNGVLTSQEEFNAMVWPKLFLGVFVVIGVCFIVAGLRKILKNAKTATHGVEAYGVIMRAFPSNTSVNDEPIMNGEIAVAIDGSVRVFTESLGLRCKKGSPGECVVVKYYQDDINIVTGISFDSLPFYERDLLKNYYEQANGIGASEISVNEDVGDYVVVNLT